MNTKINVFDHFGAIKSVWLVVAVLVLSGCSAMQPKPEQKLEAVAPIVNRPDG